MLDFYNKRWKGVFPFFISVYEHRSGTLNFV